MTDLQCLILLVYRPSRLQLEGAVHKKDEALQVGHAYMSSNIIWVCIPHAISYAQHSSQHW